MNKFLSSLILAFYLAVSCTEISEPKFLIYSKDRLLMGTLFKIKVFASEKKLSKAAFTEISTKAFEEISRLEDEMSEFKPESPISLAAKYSGRKAIPITDDIINVLEIALKISNETEGVFDISFKPLGWVWNVKKRKAPPSDDRIKKALSLVDYRNIVLNRNDKTLFLRKKGMHIGLGGVAKGYATLKAGEILKDSGINDFIINAGGDLFVYGSKNGNHWTSGIKDPDSQNLVLKFKIKRSGGIVTSGDYERYFIHNGIRYHHIIDTETGYPTRGLRSVTVFSTDPTRADALSTSFFIMGYNKSLEFIKRNPGTAFVMIDENKNILKSPNIDKYIEFFN